MGFKGVLGTAFAALLIGQGACRTARSSNSFTASELLENTATAFVDDSVALFKGAVHAIQNHIQQESSSPSP